MAPLSQDVYSRSNDDSAHSTMTSESTSSKSKVSFTTIEIREYERVVGDHPETKVGPPMAIGWAFVEKEITTVEDFEFERTTSRKGTRRMSSITRKNILTNVFEIPEEEIRSAEKEVQKIVSKRERTNKQGKVAEKVEEKLESFGRKIRRTFSSERLWKGLMDSQMVFPSSMMVH
jgi:hypothetical protein